ncbi:MAG: (d)CMP kinase [Alphaproteobacteria bacterium]|jgi:CMP/dCMP kinase|nr:(d)CMP kinase [Alphaproteobacteria bacterium]MBT4085601.1 (d)CMP kinase [Alphaproteobacteria bacterium]MBT4544448.1 (d)CMP kinase [Alphaproteobacteria bacterium]MBT5159472.1 (d)CMP kinase [Alphaproteobacteria bacterium]MBT7746223.1 (d)CMP kinase [Alphaproteobacteria bacterium]
MIIAIDGPAAAGKGTLARKLATEFNLAFLDTGALYRATGLRVMRNGTDLADAQAVAAEAQNITLEDRENPALRDEATGDMASKVSAIPEVRAALLDYQRNFATNPPEGFFGSILDGRDIGTVVCPNADAKIFVTASDEVRAHRRWLELSAKDNTVQEAVVLAEMQQRDARDAARATAPMKAAEDAHLLDTSNLAIDAAFDAAKEFVSSKF